MLKLKLQYFGHLIRRADSFEKTLMLGKIEGRRRRGDGCMALPTRWTWVWVGSGSRLREAWWAAVHGVTKSWTQLSDWSEWDRTEPYRAPGHESLSLFPLLCLPKGRFKELLIRDGGTVEIRQQPRNNSEALEAESWFFLKGCMSSLSSSAETPYQMECVNSLMEHSSFQRRSQFIHHHLMLGDLWVERSLGWKISGSAPSLTLISNAAGLEDSSEPPSRMGTNRFKSISSLWLQDLIRC